MSNFIEQLDDLMCFESCCDGDAIAQSIINLINKEIIGSDELYERNALRDAGTRQVRNHLRYEQRKKLGSK